MPKVSVIIPVYGVEKYIERCARSLFEQTLDDIEYIFVDDCTPDKSIEILESIIEEYRLRFAEEKKVVRIVRMPTNSGQAAVRRHGIQLATGDYIIHCDSDDWVVVDMYRAMYQKAIETDSDIVICDYVETDGIDGGLNKIVKGCCTTDKLRLVDNMLRMTDSWPVWNKLCKRKLYDGDFIYPAAALGEDMVISIQLVWKSERISYINKVFNFYYFNPESITKKNNNTAKEICNIYRQRKQNTDLLVSYINSTGITSLQKHLLSQKWVVKKMLWRLVFIPQYRKMWKDTYPEINYFLFFSSVISLKDKFCYAATLLYLYPLKEDRILLNPD